MKKIKDLSPEELSSIREEIEKEVQDKYAKELEIVYQDAMECRDISEDKLDRYRDLTSQLRYLKQQKKTRDVKYRKEVNEIAERLVQLEDEFETSSISSKSMIAADIKSMSNKKSSNFYGKIQVYDDHKYDMTEDCGNDEYADGPPIEFSPAISSKFTGFRDPLPKKTKKYSDNCETKPDSNYYKKMFAEEDQVPTTDS